MSRKVCKDAIRGRIGDAFSDDEIDAALDRLVRRQQQKRGAAPGDDEAARLKETIAELTREALEDNLIEKRIKAHSLRASARRKQAIAALPDDLSAGRKLAAVNVGSERLGTGAGLSVDARRRALYSEWSGEMIRDLESLGTLSRLANPLRRRDKAFEADVAREFARLNGGSESPTGNVNAHDTARVLKKVQDKTVAAQNAQGAFISRLDGYVVKQTHDAVRISGGYFKGMRAEVRAKARTDWIDFISPLLDTKTFDDVDDVADFLGTIWTDIISGHHKGADNLNDLDAIRPSGLLAGRVSANRVLHFKDADSWMSYNERFGSGSVFDAFSSQLDGAANNAALLQVWGPNPKAAFDNTRNQLIKAARKAGDEKAIKDLKSKIRDYEFGELDGSTAAPANIRIASFGRALRLQQGLAKLGGMTLSSVSDTSLAAATLRRPGVNLFESYNAVLGGITRLQSPARKEAASMVNVGSRQIIGNMVSRFSATDGATGTLGKLQAQFYTLNLFSAWGGGIRSGVGAMLSHQLGRNSGLSYKSLDKDLAAQLGRYGIGAPEWTLLRKGAQRLDDGNLYLTPETVNDLPEEALTRWGKGRAFPHPEAARAELRTRLQAYFTDITETAMTEPRAREQAFLNAGQQAGTAVGEALRIFMQFKSFPTTIQTRHLYPTLTGQAGISPLAGLAHIIVAGTVLGYIARQTKQIAKGLTPEPLVKDGKPNMKLLVASLVQGGGLGIYGDFMFSDFNRYGSSPLATLGGPGVGELEGLFRIYGALKDGDDVGARALRQAIGNVPFNNLFYTRAALDYLVFYQMQEWVNPGSLERYERRIAKDRGQKFLIPPSETVNN